MSGNRLESPFLKDREIPRYSKKYTDMRAIMEVEERIQNASHNIEANTIRALPVLPQFPQPTMAKRVNP